MGICSPSQREQSFASGIVNPHCQQFVLSVCYPVKFPSVKQNAISRLNPATLHRLRLGEFGADVGY
jgi:hypothetical protein